MSKQKILIKVITNNGIIHYKLSIVDYALATKNGSIDIVGTNWLYCLDGKNSLKTIFYIYICVCVCVYTYIYL